MTSCTYRVPRSQNPGCYPTSSATFEKEVVICTCCAQYYVNRTVPGATPVRCVECFELCQAELCLSDHAMLKALRM